jgi:hypothetical protein
MKTKTPAGSPPKHTQFQKGKSGNPCGRPKGSRNLSGLLKQALEARVEHDGEPMTKLEAAVKQIADNAAAGDPRILQMLLAELRRLEPASESAPPHDCFDVVRAEMKNAREEFLAKFARLQASHAETLAKGICPTCGAAVSAGGKTPLFRDKTDSPTP